MPMQAKCSMHCGGKYSIEHNLRQYDETKWNLDNHISSDRRFLNVTLANIELRTFIDEQFGDALVVANEKNRKRHPDRLIGFKDKYDYDSCPIEERRERAVNAYYREQRKNVQEMIVQLGDHKNYLEKPVFKGLLRYGAYGRNQRRYATSAHRLSACCGEQPRNDTQGVYGRCFKAARL